MVSPMTDFGERGCSETGGGAVAAPFDALFSSTVLLVSPRCPPAGLCELVVDLRASLGTLVSFAGQFPDPDPGGATGAASALVLDTAANRLASANTEWFWVPDPSAQWMVPAALSLPDDITCDTSVVPPAGVVAFDSLVLAPGGDGVPCPVRGAVWFVDTLGADDTPAVYLVWFSDGPEGVPASEPLSRVAPAGWSVWGHGDGLREGCGRGDADAHSWDRRVLSVLWHLLANPALAVPASELPPRPRRRAAQRAGVRTPPAGVRLVHLSPTLRPGGDPDGEAPTPAQRSVRWWVRGHWRSQPYGPLRALRRPVWIDAHVRGPAAAPLRAQTRTVVAVDAPQRNP